MAEAASRPGIVVGIPLQSPVVSSEIRHWCQPGRYSWCHRGEGGTAGQQAEAMG